MRKRVGERAFFPRREAAFEGSFNPPISNIGSEREYIALFAGRGRSFSRAAFEPEWARRANGEFTEMAFIIKPFITKIRRSVEYLFGSRIECGQTGWKANWV
jgi:hypothetical protein